jgi:hypothetical protein
LASRDVPNWWGPSRDGGFPKMAGGSHWEAMGPRFLWRGDAFYGQSKAGAPPAQAFVCMLSWQPRPIRPPPPRHAATPPPSPRPQARPPPRARTARIMPRRLHRGDHARAWLHDRNDGRAGARRVGNGAGRAHGCRRPGDRGREGAHHRGGAADIHGGRVLSSLCVMLAFLSLSGAEVQRRSRHCGRLLALNFTVSGSGRHSRGSSPEGVCRLAGTTTDWPSSLQPAEEPSARE